MSNEETKVCKLCGRELPIDKFKNKQSYIWNVCKDCYNEKIREKHYQQRLSDELEKYNNGELVKIRRKFKKLYHFQILYRSELKRALEKTNALVYNLIRKVIGCNSDLPSVKCKRKE